MEKQNKSTKGPSVNEMLETIKERMKKIKNKIVVLSGKGGVGKSTVVAELAAALAKKEKKVGIFDADLHGPSIPKIISPTQNMMVMGNKIIPAEFKPLNIKIISIDFLLPSEDSPLIWRGPLKGKAIIELLYYTEWGDLDYLLVDLPPGTGDEPLTIAQSILNLSGAIVVTIPSLLSEKIVAKAIKFCEILKIPLLGVIENMSYFICPKCGSKYYIFGKGAGEDLAQRMNIQFLGQIPLDPRIREAHDRGVPFVFEHENTETAKEIIKIADKIVKTLEKAR